MPEVSPFDYGQKIQTEAPFKACEVWQDRFVGHGRVIKRERAGKETIAGNAMRIRRMR